MEFTLTFTEIINKLIDLSLFGMESFIAIWLFAGFAASAYPDSVTLPIKPTETTPALNTTSLPMVTVPESTTTESSPDIATAITELSCKTLRNLLSTLEVKSSGMNKESMVTTLLSKITEEELDISLLLAMA